MAAHGQPCRAQRDSGVVDLGGGASGGVMLAAPEIEGDDGRDLLGVQLRVEALGIQARVMDCRADRDGEAVGREELEQPV